MSELSEPARDAAGRFLPPPRSPERAALAEALSRREAAAYHLARTEAALIRAGEMGREAYGREAAATAALTAAREGEPRWLADSLLAEREPGTSPLRAAEQALTEAREAREAARNADVTLRQQVEQDQRAVDSAGRAVRRAAAAVLALDPGVEEAITRLERAEAELVDAGDQVLWLAGAGVIDIRTRPEDGWRDDSNELEQRAHRAAMRLEQPPVGWLTLIRQKPGTAAWEHALAALVDDDDAGPS